MDSQYEVVSPWADVDPIPLKGIVPRIKDLNGKKIGLYRNFKRAAKPILVAVESKLKERFPTCETIWYTAESGPGIKKEDVGVNQWLKEVDTVIAAVGD